jgi:hypothetical protein
MHRRPKFIWMLWTFCLVIGAGCSKSDESSSDKNGIDSKNNGSTDTDSDSDQSRNTGSDSDADRDTDTAGDLENDAICSPESSLIVLDHDNCQLAYAPAMMVSYEADGRFVGLYEFIYNDAGDLVRFIEQVSTLVEYEFEYEGTRLVKTTSTVDAETTEVYEATYEYDDKGQPTKVKGRSRESTDTDTDTPWIYSSVEMIYENQKLVQRLSRACEAEDACNELVIDRRYTYNEQGRLTQMDYTRETRNTRWEFEYDAACNLISKVLTLNANKASNEGERYIYEDNHLVQSDIFTEDGIVYSRAYVHEDGRLRMNKYSDIGRYTEFEWTEDATACDLLRAWHLMFLHPDFGITSQEMLMRIYGIGNLTETYF